MGGNAFNPSEVYDTLRQQDVLPLWRRTPSTATGAYVPSRNVMLAPQPTASNPITRDTAAHEMSHGVQNLMAQAARLLMERRWNREKLDPVEQQFLDTYLKTMGDLPGRVGQFDRTAYDRAQASLRRGVTAMGGDVFGGPTTNDKTYKAYRTSPEELQAWGVGVMSDPTGATGKITEQPRHLNPSFATEFSILMDNYKRLPAATQQAAAAQLRTTAAEGRQRATGMDQVLQSVMQAGMPYADPFK